VESKIIFDVSTKPFAWQPLWASLGALIFGCVLIFLHKLKRRSSAQIGGYFMIVCGILNAGVSSVEWFMARRSQMHDFAAGRHETVEGTIEDFHPMPKDGSSEESFTVSGHHFSYSDYNDLEPTPCFNQTALHEGPIRSGMLVRVKFIDRCIVHIEVLSAKPASSTRLDRPSPD
jgi:hypothetical protein